LSTERTPFLTYTHHIDSRDNRNDAKYIDQGA